MSKQDKSQGINKLCAKCIRTCRQAEAILLVDCPRFKPLPFKVEKHRYDQMDLFGNPTSRRK